MCVTVISRPGKLYDMKNTSQIDIEKRYILARADMDGGRSFNEAYGRLENWLLDLGEDKAFFNPLNNNWYFLDQAHRQWVPSGFGAGRAIIISTGGVSGAKNIPQTFGKEIGAAVEELSDWCFYDKGDNISGPVRKGELDTGMLSGSMIWSPLFSRWIPAGEWTALCMAVPAVPQRVKRFCPECGKPLKPEARFCAECGTKLV